jgi:hypothetical protein
MTLFVTESSYSTPSAAQLRTPIQATRRIAAIDRTARNVHAIDTDYVET